MKVDVEYLPGVMYFQTCMGHKHTYNNASSSMPGDSTVMTVFGNRSTWKGRL